MLTVYPEGKTYCATFGHYEVVRGCLLWLEAENLQVVVLPAQAPRSVLLWVPVASSVGLILVKYLQCVSRGTSGCVL